MDVEMEYLAAVIPLFSAYAAQHPLRLEVLRDDQLILSAAGKICRVKLLAADLLDLPDLHLSPFDGVIAHAVLDLLPLNRTLPVLYDSLKPCGWLYSTINFDGLTLLEPEIDPALDTAILRAYHDSMDQRSVGEGQVSAGSYAGRKLFHALRKNDFEIQAAGASDWFVFANQGKYPFDEAFFLEFMLRFFEDSVGKSGVVNENLFHAWLNRRREQVKHGTLMLVTHQYDYFARRKNTNLYFHGRSQ
jgi:SAM-dependent methyltransferase